MFPHSKSVHHGILCIAEQIQLMTKTTQGPVITAQNTFNDIDSIFSNGSGDTDLLNALCSDSHRAVFCPNSVLSGWKN
jgi:hypothetical protein